MKNLLFSTTLLAFLSLSLQARDNPFILYEEKTGRVIENSVKSKNVTDLEEEQFIRDYQNNKNKTAEEPTKAPQTQVVQEKSYSKKEVDSLMLKTKYEAEQKAKALVKKELKKNEEQQQLLIEQKRKAEIGELLGNISHQWKNGLSQISSLNLEMILMYKLNQNINDNKEFYQRLEDTESSIKFMVETMNTFLGYYKEESDYSKFKVEENIRQVKKLIDLEIKKSNLNINIISNFPLEITANKNEWLHVWLNFISNTIKASKLQNIENPQINITINEKNITYEDNCGGFQAEVLEDIQKHKQKGLGLKMSLKIIEKSNYFMDIKNYNSGAKFIIFNQKTKK